MNKYIYVVSTNQISENFDFRARTYLLERDSFQKHEHFQNFFCLLITVRNVTCGRRGRPYMDYIGMYRPGYGFQAVYSGSIYKTESLGRLEQGIIFQEIDQLFEAFSLGPGRQGIFSEKYKRDQQTFSRFTDNFGNIRLHH